MSIDGYKDYLFKDIEGLNITNKVDLIPMWIADMEFETSNEIIEALKNRAEHGVFGYTQIFEEDYVKAFYNWCMSRYQWSFNIDHLVTSKGIVPALFDLTGYICNSDDKVLIFTPSYAFFKHTVDQNNLELVTSDLIYKNGDYSIDYEDVKIKAKDPKVTLCIICSPHNPTGKLWSDFDLIKLGNILINNNVTIISDEVHCDLLREGKTFSPLSKLFPHSNSIITCMAASKTFNLAGFMLANIIIPDDQIRFTWLESRIPLDNPFSITATQAAYQAGHEWLSELTVYLDENFIYLKLFLEKNLPRSIFKIPDSTYLAWVDLSSYFNEGINLTKFFAENAGVLLEGGNMFVSNSNGFIRLNLACPRVTLEKALNRITDAINLHIEKKI